MASAVARAYNGGLGAEHNYTFHKPIFAEFLCHFGEIQSFCKLLKLLLAVSFVSINDVALTS